MPLPNDSLCYFRDPEYSWLWGKVLDYDAKKKVYSCQAIDEGNSRAEPDRVPPVLTQGKYAGGWPDPIPGVPTKNIPDNEDNIFSVREDVVYGSEYEDTHDLLRLTILHDSTLLACVKKRYFKDIIYTFIGAIVVAVNPFNYKIPWYTDDNMEKYLQETYPIQKNLPHSWACAHNTYHELRDDKRNQTILVSGESGAGKTEASKIVLKYLSAISSRMSGVVAKEGQQDVQARIMAASPFLEAFGNAKTARNDNSSRFGKFMQIKFSEEGAILGANITKYLLEKSRIIVAGPGERVYHSFYLAVRGNGKPLGPNSLVSVTDYSSLNSGGCTENNEFNTGEEFDEVSDAMRTVGILDDDVRGIWLTLAGVLHALNVTFEKNGEGSKIASAKVKELASSAQCLGVDNDMLSLELVRTVIEVRGEKSNRDLNVSKAQDGRDAFVKRLYDQVFNWLVDKCNQSLDIAGDLRWIGLLDIFGFEHFEVNSFEQLCINTANEALQGNYNTHIFAKDMEECRAEGINVTEVEFPDNTPCIDLVMKSKPPGIFSLLDSASLLSKGDPGEDLKWLEQIAQEFSKHKFFEKKRLARDSFVVKHFAGDVSYSVKGFVEKNADTLKDAWRDVVTSSSKSFVRELLWQNEKKLTVAGFFKQQLADLMAIINASNPHWIRCVKPHPAKKPMLFDGNQVAFQLTTSGVLATVSIRKAGYPVRLLFADFTRRYRVLFYETAAPSDPKEACVRLLEVCGFTSTRAQLGVTRVFLKQDAYVECEDLKRRCTNKVAVLCQQLARARLSKLNEWRPRLWLASAKAIQGEARVFLERSRDLRRERAEWRRREEESLVEALCRNSVAEEEARHRCFVSADKGRFGVWVEKVRQETRAAALGLGGDEDRARTALEAVEEEARGALRVKLRWAIDMKPVLEVELQEEAVRVQVVREIGERWMALLNVWMPMKFFELEMGRGPDSELFCRRRIADEEQDRRRLLVLQVGEHRVSAEVAGCGLDEERRRTLLALEEAESYSLVKRDYLASSRSVRLAEYAALLRGDLAQRGVVLPDPPSPLPSSAASTCGGASECGDAASNGGSSRWSAVVNHAAVSASAAAAAAAGGACAGTAAPGYVQTPPHSYAPITGRVLSAASSNGVGSSAWDPRHSRGSTPLTQPVQLRGGGGGGGGGGYAASSAAGDDLAGPVSPISLGGNLSFGQLPTYNTRAWRQSLPVGSSPLESAAAASFPGPAGPLSPAQSPRSPGVRAAWRSSYSGGSLSPLTAPTLPPGAAAEPPAVEKKWWE